MSKFQIYRSGTEYRYRLLASNGENILYGEGYKTNQGCRNGISSVKLHSPFDSNYQRLVAKNGLPYFVLRANNNEPIGVSETYSSSQSREKGIEAVKNYAPSASIEDTTTAYV